jgi:hypothetical protein
LAWNLIAALFTGLLYRVFHFISISKGQEDLFQCYLSD